MTETIHLTYLFDPLCGWCYGASPVAEKLMEQDGFAIELVPTGLFADQGAFSMNAGFAAHAWKADQRIAQLTGRVFTEDYRSNVLQSEKGRVDSGPATLALTAVCLTAPEREFEAQKAIQSARYVYGRDNGDQVVIADVLAKLDLKEAAHASRRPIRNCSRPTALVSRRGRPRCAASAHAAYQPSSLDRDKTAALSARAYSMATQIR